MGEGASSFAINFAKLALLINVGRMNTTLAFYPEMKTALRTFHPIPCMMKDETSARFQDSPRMKSQLKGCAIPQEVGGAENMPASINVLIHRSVSRVGRTRGNYQLTCKAGRAWLEADDVRCAAHLLALYGACGQ